MNCAGGAGGVWCTSTIPSLVTAMSIRFPQYLSSEQLVVSLACLKCGPARSGTVTIGVQKNLVVAIPPSFIVHTNESNGIGFRHHVMTTMIYCGVRAHVFA